MKKIIFLTILLLSVICHSQTDTRIYDIIDNISTKESKKILLD